MGVNLLGVESSEVAILLEGRQVMYKLLKHVFYVEPNLQFLEVVGDDEFLNTLPFTRENSTIQDGMRLIRKYFVENHNKPHKIEALRWTYTHLFVGPNALPAPPWESAYLTEDRLLFQESTLQVRHAYLKYNFTIKNFLKEPDDHIGSALDFMNQLCQLSVKNLQKKEKMIEILKDQQDFLQQHLLNWVSDFSKDIAAYDDTLFYAGMAKILDGFIKIENDLISSLLTYISNAEGDG